MKLELNQGVAVERDQTGIVDRNQLFLGVKLLPESHLLQKKRAKNQNCPCKRLSLQNQIYSNKHWYLEKKELYLSKCWQGPQKLKMIHNLIINSKRTKIKKTMNWLGKTSTHLANKLQTYSLNQISTIKR